MDSVPRSGLYYPNNLARISLLALEDVMGTNGVNALLRLANKHEYIGKLPPNNTESEIDFADFSSVAGALDEMYGKRGSKILAKRAGMATFDETLKNIGEAVDVNDYEFTALPLEEKVRVGISLVSITFTHSIKHLPSIREEKNSFIYSIDQCPICWGRHTEEPSCHMISGLLQGAVKWVTRGVEFEVTQSAARSNGSSSCVFVIPKNPESQNLS